MYKSSSRQNWKFQQATISFATHSCTTPGVLQVWFKKRALQDSQWERRAVSQRVRWLVPLPAAISMQLISPVISFDKPCSISINLVLDNCLFQCNRLIYYLLTLLFHLASSCPFYEEVRRFMTDFQTARSAAAVSWTPEAAMSWLTHSYYEW